MSPFLGDAGALPLPTILTWVASGPTCNELSTLLVAEVPEQKITAPLAFAAIVVPSGAYPWAKDPYP